MAFVLLYLDFLIKGSSNHQLTLILLISLTPVADKTLNYEASLWQLMDLYSYTCQLY